MDTIPYTVHYRDSLETGEWKVLRTIAARPQTQIREEVDVLEDGASQRFYQVSTP